MRRQAIRSKSTLYDRLVLIIMEYRRVQLRLDTQGQGYRDKSLRQRVEFNAFIIYGVISFKFN